MQSWDDHVCKGQLLCLEALLEAALHHATAVLVAANRVAIGHARIEDELGVDGDLVCAFCIRLVGHFWGLESDQIRLEHMISIWMSGEFENVLLKLVADCEKFISIGRRISAENFNEGLDGTRTMDVHRNVNYRREHGVDELLQVRNLAHFYYLLT